MNLEQAESDLLVEAQVSRAAGRHPWWFTVMGVLLIVLGVVALAASFLATLATVLLFGGLLLVGGIAQIIDSLSSRQTGGMGLRFLTGLLYAAVGGLILSDPVGGAIGLTLLLAVFFILAGVSRLLLAAQLRGGARNWLVATGIIDMALGVLIWMQWPAAGVWIIGLFVGIELLLAGIAMLLMAAERRRLHGL